MLLWIAMTVVVL